MTIAPAPLMTGTAMPSPRSSARASRSWAAPLAWGAGLVQTSMGAATLASGPTSIAAGVLAGVVFASGLAALAWGAVSLARGRLVAPGWALAGVMAGVAIGAALLLLTGGRSSVVAVGVSTVLLVALGIACAAERRTPRRAAPRVRIVPLLATAAVIALLVTPALGSVQDSTLLQDDGTVLVVPGHGH